MELQLNQKKRASFHDNGVQFGWDATSISAASTCQRYYQLSILEGWRSAKASHHLIFGGAMATALEHFYKLQVGGMDWEEALDRVVHEALEATWEYEYMMAPNAYGEMVRAKIIGTGHPWQSFDSAKTRENLIRTIVWYIDEFHDQADMTVHILADGTPAVEHSFKLPVDNGIIFSGHIDRVVDFNSDPYVMDQKTTGSTISPHWFDQFKPHHQFSMYTFAGKAIWGLPIQGVIIDGIQIAVGFSRVQRSISMRTNEELEEWYHDTMLLIEDTQRNTARGYFPMNPTACDKYGGCTYRGVCQRPPGVRRNFLVASFEQENPWDPLVPR